MVYIMTPKEQELLLANNGLSLMLFYLNTLCGGNGVWRGTVIADCGPPYIHIRFPDRNKVCFVDVHYIPSFVRFDCGRLTNILAVYQIRGDKEGNGNPYCIASDIAKMYMMLSEQNDSKNIDL